MANHNCSLSDVERNPASMLPEFKFCAIILCYWIIKYQTIESYTSKNQWTFDSPYIN